MSDQGDRDTAAAGFRREGAGLEFDRVSFFTDAVYAIAMTLLVVGLQLPEIAGNHADARALRAALGEAWPQIIGFFVGFALLGRYWMAHHQFFAGLDRIDRGLIGLNLVYLSFVAFAPFPVALISSYEENPVSFVMFALVMAAISCMEVAMFLRATRRGLFPHPVSGPMRRFGIIASGSPVVVMVLSIPLAFVSTTLALLSWLVMFPLGLWIKRLAPPDLGSFMRRS